MKLTQHTQIHNNIMHKIVNETRLDDYFLCHTLLLTNNYNHALGLFYFFLLSQWIYSWKILHTHNNRVGIKYNTRTCHFVVSPFKLNERSLFFLSFLCSYVSAIGPFSFTLAPSTQSFSQIHKRRLSRSMAFSFLKK